ncbi:hypothetical protein [Paenibacillus sp. NPDC057934]
MLVPRVTITVTAITATSLLLGYNHIVTRAVSVNVFFYSVSGD